jgi:Ala-tRNA(Pro) deacylase
MNIDATDEQKKQKVLDFFATHALPYRLYEHPAFFTVADVQAYNAAHAGDEGGADGVSGSLHAAGTTGCKNLFLKNYVEKPAAGEVYRYYLYVLPDIERADIKKFAVHVGEKKVCFATPEELLAHLGVTSGSVSLCGLINDPEHLVRAYIDSRVAGANILHFHPNVNTASMEITNATLAQYMQALGRDMSVYVVN